LRYVRAEFGFPIFDHGAKFDAHPIKNT